MSPTTTEPGPEEPSIRPPSEHGANASSAASTADSFQSPFLDPENPPGPNFPTQEDVSRLTSRAYQDFFAHMETLGPYKGPVEDSEIDPDWPPVTLELELSPLRPHSRISDDAAALECRQLAITRGARVLDKDFLFNAHQASRKMFSITFSRELEQLDVALTRIQMLRTKKGRRVYRVVKEEYTALNRMLFKLLRSSRDAFRLAGKTPPELPSWGDDLDLLDCLKPSSFLVAAVCLRVEVEHFLWILDKHYDFEEDRPQDRFVTPSVDQLHVSESISTAPRRSASLATAGTARPGQESYVYDPISKLQP
ncbi:unnamed protein product [Mycena citricolor]|uniref:Uncharacterized protein n=1 Tax=Mycena citricolor TaxID=2018698 RepID=A0AAD2K352_9AGAR|nr:unnamed protein product [Mycena citricolor]